MSKKKKLVTTWSTEPIDIEGHKKAVKYAFEQEAFYRSHVWLYEGDMVNSKCANCGIKMQIDFVTACKGKE